MSLNKYSKLLTQTLRKWGPESIVVRNAAHFTYYPDIPNNSGTSLLLRDASVLECRLAEAMRVAIRCLLLQPPKKRLQTGIAIEHRMTQISSPKIETWKSQSIIRFHRNKPKPDPCEQLLVTSLETLSTATIRQHPFTRAPISTQAHPIVVNLRRS